MFTGFMQQMITNVIQDRFLQEVIPIQVIFVCLFTHSDLQILPLATGE